MTKISRETAFARLTDIRDDHILEGDISSLLSVRAYANKSKTPSAFSRFMQSGWGTLAACAVVAVGVYVALVGLGRGWFGSPAGHPGTESETIAESEPEAGTGDEDKGTGGAGTDQYGSWESRIIESRPGYDWSSEGLEYHSLHNGTCKVSIRNFTGTALLIPLYSPDGDKVTVITGSDSCGPADLERCIMPYTIRIIEDNAFRQCTRLCYIEWSADLREIGDRAFEGCALTGVFLPGSVTRIGAGCFAGCSEMIDISLPQGVTVIPDEVCRQCTSLAFAYFSDGVTEIGSDAFADCATLYMIDLPAGLCKVGRAPFAGCTNLTEMYMHAGMKQADGAVLTQTSKPTIHFIGTMDEWAAVEKINGWDPDLKVVCMDGTVNDR